MLKPFQKQDLARAACHDGLVLAWDTGLGKTWAAFLWPLLKLGYEWQPSPNSDLRSANSALVPRGSILIIVPGDLHQQMIAEAAQRFRLRLTTIQDQADFLARASRANPSGRRVVPPGFYITSYHALAINGTRSSPSLAALCWNTFDCVVVDEGVRMKGGDTRTGQAVRKLDPRYRLVLTGTPVKNRLPDIFWLAWWAAGGRKEAHARWPYGGEPTEAGDFARTFLVSERNLTREAQAEAEGKPHRFVKPTAEVCNIHRLWKLLAPVVLRRRKQDIGEQIVPKIRHVVRVAMGTKQAATYSYHLQANYVDSRGRPAIGAKLQALRVAAAAPNSLLLKAVPTSTADQVGRASSRAGNNVPQPDLQPRSPTGYTPKIHAALRLIERFLRAGEQFVVFSAFHDPLDILSQRLRQAGVRHAVLDGRATPAKRGEIAARFKLGAPGHGRGGSLPGLLAGVECMAEGHDFFLATNVVLLAYSWAFDKFEQAINRVHRLTSPKPVHVWSILCDGTIDRKLEASIQEKGDSSELVLDGKLLGEHADELNLAQLLAVAEVEFKQSPQTIDEDTLLLEWPCLCDGLRDAQAAWDDHQPQPARTGSPIRPISPIRSAPPSWRAAFERGWCARP